MTRRRRVALGLSLTLAALALVAYGWISGWHVGRKSAAELSALLHPGDIRYVPDGRGPFPTAILFSGCSGVEVDEHIWAKSLRDLGFAAVVIDSHTPRGLAPDGKWEHVCKGHVLWGRERAGDVLVSLHEVRKLPFVDPSRIVLVGWSHGAWSVMDLLAMDPPRTLPTNLAAASSQGERGALDGVVGLVLFYPYCGFGALTPKVGWRPSVPTLMLLAGADTVVPTQACLDAAARLRGQGHEIDLHVYEGLDHAFDQTHLTPADGLAYAPEAAADARRRVAAFLAQRVAPSADASR